MNRPIGKLDRAEAGRLSKRFAPGEIIAELVHLDPHVLVKEGKKLVLLDADNTLLPWRAEELPEASKDWVNDAKAAGLELCLISNTRNKERLARLAATLELKSATGKFKPSREMYQWAMAEFKVTPQQTIMIGDQAFTDILGANRSEIDSILVHPMSQRDFVGTKFYRMLEFWLFRRLVHTMQAEEDDLPIVQKKGILQSKVVRQFLKFCLVGGSSLVIDYSIRMTLQFATKVGDRPLSQVGGEWMLTNLPFTRIYANSATDAFFPAAVFVAGMVAMVNSFFWNRLWTFRIRDSKKRTSQFVKFVAVSLMGVLLNTLISGGVNAALHMDDEKVSARIATAIAVVCVAFWNFFGQRLYAFKPEENP